MRPGRSHWHVNNTCVLLFYPKHAPNEASRQATQKHELLHQAKPESFKHSKHCRASVSHSCQRGHMVHAVFVPEAPCILRVLTLTANVQNHMRHHVKLSDEYQTTRRQVLSGRWWSKPNVRAENFSNWKPSLQLALETKAVALCPCCEKMRPNETSRRPSEHEAWILWQDLPVHDSAHHWAKPPQLWLDKL